MATWVIIAFDQSYGGLHGMCTKAIFEGTEKEAEEYAEELSIEIIQDYSDIYDTIENDIQDYLETESIDPYSNEADEIRNEFYNDDIAYELYELDETLINCGIGELEEEFYNDEDAFLAKYQKA